MNIEEELNRQAQKLADKIRRQLMEKEARLMMGEFSYAARADPFGNVCSSDPNIIEGEVVSVETVRWPETIPIILREVGFGDYQGGVGPGEPDAPTLSER